MRRSVLRQLQSQIHQISSPASRSISPKQVLPSNRVFSQNTRPRPPPISVSHYRFNTSQRHISYHKSTSAYIVLIALVTGTALIAEHFIPDTVASGGIPEEEKANPLPSLSDNNTEPSSDSLSAFYADMPVQPGFLGNLTAEQERKLQDFWVLVLKTFGVTDPLAEANGSVRPITPAGAPIQAVEETSAKKKERHGLFHRKHKDSIGSESPGSPGRSDSEDKYGQTKELAEIVANTKPEVLREAFWSMVKKDHPDALLLRFLRARKWDVQNALAMLVSTMHWRKSEMHVDDDVMIQGEGGALKDSESSTASVKKEGSDFLAQLRLGKSFLHGIDKDGRPICYVRARLHRSGEQSERSLERYTVYVIETTRLVLQAPVETATIVFDMTDFTMANMDYTPVKFMIKVFEANYPESLGSILVHKAPWIFNAIWKIIRGWLDPVVASKVHFTNGVEDLSAFIPKSQIIKELGGNEDWEYKYIEPTLDENKIMEETGANNKKEELTAARTGDVKDYEQKTFEWIHGQDTKSQRDELADKLRKNYWLLDPYIRARTLYDRTGMIKPDGTVDFYPSQTSTSATAPVNGLPPKQEAHADDVD